jgi:hypothetical protein
MHYTNKLQLLLRQTILISKSDGNKNKIYGWHLQHTFHLSVT